MKFDGIVFERPPVVFKLLIIGLGEACQFARGLSLKVDPTTQIGFVFLLIVFNPLFYPVYCNFFEVESWLQN